MDSVTKELLIASAASAEEIFADANRDNNIGDLLDNIVLTALHRRASVIHIEPRAKDLLVRYRIDGVLQDILFIDKSFQEDLFAQIKTLAKLSKEPQLLIQNGKITFKFPNAPGLDTIISILPTARGGKVVMRLLSDKTKYLSLEQLGIGVEAIKQIEANYKKDNGMLLVVGPRDSGKTTTIYSILNSINSHNKNITSIEDPVEYEIEGVNQIQVNPINNISFAAGLLAMLQQDPDIIMVGEINDNETARLAVDAALSGHLVLATLSTNDSATATSRLVAMGIQPALLTAAINLIIAQRLARLLCKNCKAEYEVGSEEIAAWDAAHPSFSGKLKVGDKYFRHSGCEECNNTGYKGRIGIYEISTSLIDGAIEKLKQGDIDMSELLQVTVTLS